MVARPKRRPKLLATLYGRPCLAVEQPKGPRQWYPIEGLAPAEPGVSRAWRLTPPKEPAEGPKTHTVTERAGGCLSCTCMASTRFTRYGRQYLRGGRLLCKHASAVFDMLDEMTGCDRGGADPAND
ncbi:unnamed protein product [Gemmataceae bacterium]|nr:unnamed protein product [Gemmataceae bacterium]VTT96525.1 unnamed protein product [Gemmataceae bacterium]